MPSPPRRFLLTTTTRDAERLRAELDRAQIEVELLAPELIRGDDGQFLFPNRASGVVSAPQNAAQQQQIDESIRELRLDVLTLEMPMAPASELDNRLVRLAQVSDALTGHLMRNILVQQGIEAIVTGDAFDTDARLTLGHGGAVGLYVREEDVAQAQAALENVLEEDVLHVPVAEADDADAEVFAWPQCPNCGERRLAICPICETSGTEFPIADNNFSAGEAATKFACICTICDEPWPPDFPPQCEWCNYDFESGRVIAEDAAEPAELPHDNDFEPLAINGRVAIAILGLVAVLGLVGLWFMAIASSR